METLSLTDAQAASLAKILKACRNSKTLTIPEGSLTMHDVTLEWKEGVIRVSVTEEILNRSTQEG